MMGNAAIQAAERARELLADAASRARWTSRTIASCSRIAACSTAQDPRTRRHVPGGGLPRRSARSARSARPARTRRRRSAAQFKGGGVGPSPTYSYTAAVVEVEVDPDTGWITVPRVWIAHDIGRALNPTLVRGQVEGSVYMGLGEALMEEQAFRRLPPKLSQRARAQVPVDARVQEPDEPRHAGDRHGARRAPRSAPARSARRKSARGRCCRSCRRSPTPCTTRSACASTRCRSRRRRSCKALAAKAAGKPARYGPRVSRTCRGPSRCSCRRRGRAATAARPTSRRARRAQGGRGRRSPRGGAAMMRLPAFRFRAPRTVAEAAAWLAEAPAETMLLAGGTDLLPNMKRRQQTPRTVIALRRIDALRARRTNGDGSCSAPASRSPSSSATIAFARRARALAGRGAGRDAAPAQHGHARRQPLPRHALHYYDQSYEWRQAIDFCMKKDGGTCWVATSSPTVPGRVVHRHGADARRARRARDARVGCRRRDARRGRSLRKTTACTT